MAIPFRADLQHFLAAFIDQHRGLRMGRLFGRPAGYAGRRMFVCLLDDGFIVKLPQGIAKDEVRAGRASLFKRHGSTAGGWIKYTPGTARQAGRLTPILELAVQHAVRA